MGINEFEKTTSGLAKKRDVHDALETLSNEIDLLKKLVEILEDRLVHVMTPNGVSNAAFKDDYDIPETSPIKLRILSNSDSVSIIRSKIARLVECLDI